MARHQRPLDAEVGIWVVDPANPGQLINVHPDHERAIREEEWRNSLFAQGYEHEEIDRMQDALARRRRRPKNRGVSPFQTKDMSDLGYLRGGGKK